jgi:hypothetical protein
MACVLIIVGWGFKSSGVRSSRWVAGKVVRKKRLKQRLGGVE